MALIQCEHVALGYGKQVLVQGLDLEVTRGDYLCIVGDNGVGKSTFLRTLLGLQPLLAGQITLGEGLTQKDLGYLPQQTQVQRDFPATVEEIVSSGFGSAMGLRPFLSRGERNRVEENLQRMGIAHLQSAATVPCPGASSSGCGWPGLCAPPTPCCCWTSRWRGWTRRVRRRCMT